MNFTDHFTGKALNGEHWLFCNMTSPCIEVPKRMGDSRLALPEHDRWNEGNCLLSRRFLGENSRVSGLFTGWDEDCSGAAVGFYAGDGSFSKFVMLAATDAKIQLRIHAGAQNGDSFMPAQPKWYVAAEAEWTAEFPVELTLYRDGTRYRAEVNGKPLLDTEIPEIQGDARAMFKALPWQDRFSPRYAYLDRAEIEGFAPTGSLSGTVMDAQSGLPVPGAGVHIAGFDRFFTLTDAQGRFRIGEVPRGAHVLIAAAEGYAFSRADAVCTPGQPAETGLRLTPETAETCPRREYNNPAFDRSESGFLPLNGTWTFQFDPENAGIAEHWYEPEHPQYNRHIRVPFSWASLMGFGEEHLVCGDTLHEHNTMFNNFRMTGEHAWYRRKFTVPENFPAGEHVILHIGASSNVTNVWMDGDYQGMRIDEYSDLTFDLGKLAPGSEHTLAVKVQFPHDIPSHNMGKQIFWFPSAPGIWQSVWIEHRAAAYIKTFHLRPELEFDGESCTKAQVRVTVAAAGADTGTVAVTLRAPESGTLFRTDIPLSGGQGEAVIPVTEPELWQYREGRLYMAQARLFLGQTQTDLVKSYTGLRRVETKWLPGHSPEETDDPQNQYQYVYLNNRPFYMLGILDQCYNAFGIYTYRSLHTEGEQGARGSIAYDIDRTLAYGYNTSRVHIKENEPLWYAECDRRGLPVWTEHPSNFYAVPEDPNWQAAYRRELTGMLSRLHNHPCIIGVSTINESWGITGGHSLTPWENQLKAEFMEQAARQAKKVWPHVLVCDNSGFGKTAAGELNDFHLYPSEHWKAKARWEALVKDCYPGSVYNYIHHSHSPHAIGNAVQTGRPVLVSEFLHINGIDMQLRMFEKIAGYVRMNVGSHDMEDSAPLTAERFERDYGYVDADMNPVGYDMVNNMDTVVWDQARIFFAEPGQTVTVPLYTSHFAWRRAGHPVLHLTVTGIDLMGHYRPGLYTQDREIAFTPYAVERQADFILTVPENIRGAYLFAEVKDGRVVLCRNYIQLCVQNVRDTTEKLAEIAVCGYTDIQGDYRYEEVTDAASAVAISGRGSIGYRFAAGQAAPKAVLVLEAGAREGRNAVKVTDECRHGSTIEIILDGVSLGTIVPLDDPSDERGLFSNAMQSREPYHYGETGRLGYGERFEVPLPQGLSAGEHILRFVCDKGGMTLYGAYAGRYGFAPSILALS